ncbi:Terminase RNaseH-like domain protein [Caballeronia sp. SBC1]|uniref:phage terminase large subunit family protein n=1 Tax=unclassified Caballeronia TaxID=2646786 RepID=UPI0013E16C7E|nr:MULTISPECIES: hypothetical protein [unclassified Caballeronia]QIE25457.1 Terminase RNaseH-like domain protein [Caballeronia sp. SBC2]QIN63507.1 Terminase RNaseH-like domain protein [Caballeronia sp. SBC1]
MAPMDFEAQAEAIRQVKQQYNVTYMAIDTTGIGQGVYQLVRQFYPHAVALNYSPEVKGRLRVRAHPACHARARAARIASLS